MLRSLFGKIPTRDEIERDVNQQIETLARSGHNPPPPGWTVIGGLPASERPSAPEPRPAPDASLEAERAEAGIVAPQAKPTTRSRAATKPAAPRARVTAKPATKPATTRRAPASRPTSPKAASAKPAARKASTSKPGARKATAPKPAARKSS